MIELDFSKIDLIFENACLKLDLLKTEFQVKPEPKVIEVPAPCYRCNGLEYLARTAQSEDLRSMLGRSQNCFSQNHGILGQGMSHLSQGLNHMVGY